MDFKHYHVYKFLILNETINYRLLSSILTKFQKDKTKAHVIEIGGVKEIITKLIRLVKNKKLWCDMEILVF